MCPPSSHPRLCSADSPSESLKIWGWIRRGRKGGEGDGQNVWDLAQREKKKPGERGKREEKKDKQETRKEEKVNCRTPGDQGDGRNSDRELLRRKAEESHSPSTISSSFWFDKRLKSSEKPVGPKYMFQLSPAWAEIHCRQPQGCRQLCRRPCNSNSAQANRESIETKPLRLWMIGKSETWCGNRAEVGPRQLGWGGAKVCYVEPPGTIRWLLA